MRKNARKAVLKISNSIISELSSEFSDGSVSRNEIFKRLRVWNSKYNTRHYRREIVNELLSISKSINNGTLDRYQKRRVNNTIRAKVLDRGDSFGISDIPIGISDFDLLINVMAWEFSEAMRSAVQIFPNYKAIGVYVFGRKLDGWLINRALINSEWNKKREEMKGNYPTFAVYVNTKKKEYYGKFIEG